MKRQPLRFALALALVCLSGLAAPLVGDGVPEDAAGRIVGAALVESHAWDKLAWLSDRVGHRLAGSPGLAQAVEWAAAEFERDGMDRVWTDEVAVPHWERGEESARILSPTEHSISLLALGGSVPTPADGIAADVVLVHGFEELAELGEERVSGKIVLYHKPIQPGFDSEHGYGSAVRLRSRGASEAAKLGAVGMLIRSLGTVDYRLAHTGGMRYQEEVERIPAAAIAAEDADLIQRLLDAGETVRVELKLGCRTLPETTSHNVLAEIRGREKPDEIVLIGAHLDSWDVGTGAIDDGAGCAIVMETMRLLKHHGLIPRRTIRAVLFTNEENGLRGGRDYARRYEDDMDLHVAAIESDSGGGTPLGFGVSAGEGVLEVVRGVTSQLAIIGADGAFGRGGGADISPMRAHGVPQMALVQDATHYFDYHHTHADTLDKVDKKDLDRNVAAMALMAYVLAERDDVLPRLPPPSEND
jgi:Zn-dependent M28 family amino/carboxypeptidase